jgi:hypothetical protein
MAFRHCFISLLAAADTTMKSVVVDGYYEIADVTVG